MTSITKRMILRKITVAFVISLVICFVEMCSFYLSLRYKFWIFQVLVRPKSWFF